MAQVPEWRETKRLLELSLDMVAGLTHAERLMPKGLKERTLWRVSKTSTVQVRGGKLQGAVALAWPYLAYVRRMKDGRYRVFATIPRHRVRLTVDVPTAQVTAQSGAPFRHALQEWASRAGGHMAGAMRRMARGFDRTGDLAPNVHAFTMEDKRNLALVNAQTAKRWGPVIDSVPWNLVHAHGTCGRMHFRLEDGQFVVYLVAPGAYGTSLDATASIFEDPALVAKLVKGMPFKHMGVEVFPRLYGPGEGVQDTTLQMTDGSSNRSFWGMYRIPFETGFNIDHHRPNAPPLWNRILRATQHRVPIPFDRSFKPFLLSELVSAMGKGVYVLTACRTLDFFPYMTKAGGAGVYTGLFKGTTAHRSPLDEYFAGAVDRRALEQLPQGRDMRFLRGRNLQAAKRFDPKARRLRGARDMLHPTGGGDWLSGLETYQDRRRSVRRRGRGAIITTMNQAKLRDELVRLIRDTNAGPGLLRPLLKHVTNRAVVQELRQHAANKGRKHKQPGVEVALARRARQLA